MKSASASQAPTIVGANQRAAILQLSGQPSRSPCIGRPLQRCSPSCPKRWATPWSSDATRKAPRGHSFSFSSMARSLSVSWIWLLFKFYLVNFYSGDFIQTRPFSNQVDERFLISPAYLQLEFSTSFHECQIVCIQYRTSRRLIASIRDPLTASSRWSANTRTRSRAMLATFMAIATAIRSSAFLVSLLHSLLLFLSFPFKILFYWFPIVLNSRKFW